MRSYLRVPALLAALSAAAVISACAVQPQVKKLQDQATTNIQQAQESAALPIPVVSTTDGAWLMGDSVQVAPPPSPMLTRLVAYHPARRVSLSDVADWIWQNTGLAVDTVEVQNPGSPSQSTTGASAALPPMPSMPVPGGAAPMMIQSPLSGQPNSMKLSYEGSLSGLLDMVANKSGIWWKFADGRVSFFRTETRTFYIPSIARKSSGTGTITASTGAAGGSGGSGGGSSGSGSSGSSGTSTGGSTSTNNYEVDVWSGLQKTAETVAGAGAHVIADAAIGSITITGTPPQVRHIKEWVRGLSDNLSQQVAITVHVYRIKVSNEDNYNWNPSVVFNSLSAKYGFTLAGPQSPSILSGIAPLKMAANVLQTATGTTGQYSGSQLAFQALSTLGRVSETVQQTVVTLNGQPAPIQVATQTSYLASSAMGSATAVGVAPPPPTLTPGTITTGFTAMFLPRIVNGKILLAMNLTSSSLVGIGSAGSGGSSIQTPTVDSSTFQQSVSLTPGDALLLTGLQQDNGQTRKSGTGSANNAIFGGGIDSSKGKQLIAIVITAKVL